MPALSVKQSQSSALYEEYEGEKPGVTTNVQIDDCERPDEQGLTTTLPLLLEHTPRLGMTQSYP